MSRVDLHLHLLPGVDDGAPDEAAALAHARRMVTGGVRTATVTPHVGSPWFPRDPLTIPARTAALQRALDREGIALTLEAGGEVHPSALGTLSAAMASSSRIPSVRRACSPTAAWSGCARCSRPGPSSRSTRAR